MKTTRLLVLLLAFPVAACTVGGADGPGDDVVDPPTTISGSITSDTTVMGAVGLTGDATVEAGVTLTLAPGTVLEATVGKSLRVKGTLIVNGAAGQEVMMMPGAGQGAWAGIVAETGSTVNLQYVVGTTVANFLYSHTGSVVTIDHVTMAETTKALVVEGTVTVTNSRFDDIKMNAGVNILSTGTLTASDTYFYGSGGDTIVQTGGALVLDHIDVGSMSTAADHCALHLNPGSDVTISYSNIRDTSVGLMIGGTTGANFTFNNFSNLENLLLLAARQMRGGEEKAVSHAHILSCFMSSTLDARDCQR
jgi:hypothetical protein